jgi:isopenicillin N synthase-like dioxygenase
MMHYFAEVEGCSMSEISGDKLPVIDVAALAGSDTAAKRAVAARLGAACREMGFFYIANHGIPPAAVAGVFAAARDFFARPPAEKQRLSIRHSPHNRGYVDLSEERLDPTGSEDHKEAFNIGLELPPDHPDILAGAAFRGANSWPDQPVWRAVMLDYFDRCWAVGRLLHRGFSLDLGVPEAFFEDKLDAPTAVLRLLHYPARSTASGALGAGAHTDYGNVTILATDGVAGLQVRDRAGRWIDAPTIPGTFVCNVGDCLMRWTNDAYLSTPHRVAAPATERYSIAFFLDPNPDALVAPIGTPAKYPAITGGEYLRRRLDATYAHRTA